MLRKLLKVTLAGSIGMLALVLAQTENLKAQDKEKKADKKLSTKQIMGIGHGGAKGLFDKVKAGVKAKKWEDATGPAKDLAENGSLFPKATPPHGDAKSWEDLAGKYADNTKALYEAVDKKDADAAGKAIDAIGGSCMGCHMNHRPAKKK